MMENNLNNIKQIDSKFHELIEELDGYRVSLEMEYGNNSGMKEVVEEMHKLETILVLWIEELQRIIDENKDWHTELGKKLSEILGK